MLNIEQELEMCGGGYEPSQYTVVNARLDGDYILVDLCQPGRGDRPVYYSWTFWAKTGVYETQENQDNPVRLRPKSATLPITHYFLFAGHKDWGKEGWVKLPQEQFDNGKDAADRMKLHNGLFTSSMSPFRMMVKPETELSPIRDYNSWAEFRFSTGEWQPLPWADEPWFKENVPEYHHAHFGVADNCMVAFWDCELNAQRDTVVILTPGRYLARYFSDHLTETEIQKWAVKADAECELKFVTEPDDIVAIYRRGPSSCMSHSLENYSSSVHPVSVYGAGDLALAYLERRGKIIARAICWPEKKAVGRRYGDIDRLEDRMKAEGWQLDSDDSSASGRGNGLLDGARLLRIEEGSGDYVMPYIDAGYGVCWPPSTMEDADKYFVLSRHDGDLDCTNTNGLTDGDRSPEYDYHCESCGEGLDEDDAYYLDGWGYYCNYHYDERTTSCDRCEDRVHNDYVRDVGDDYWCNTCIENHATSCDICSERVPDADIINVYDARYDEGEEPSDIQQEVCASCRDDEDSIQQDHRGHWIDTETATQCSSEDCSAWFSAELTACPKCETAVNENDNNAETPEVEQVA